MSIKLQTEFREMWQHIWSHYVWAENPAINTRSQQADHSTVVIQCDPNSKEIENTKAMTMVDDNIFVRYFTAHDFHVSHLLNLLLLLAR